MVSCICATNLFTAIDMSVVSATVSLNTHTESLLMYNHYLVLALEMWEKDLSTAFDTAHPLDNLNSGETTWTIHRHAQ